MAPTEDELTRRFAEIFGSPPEGESWSGDDAAVVRSPARIVLTVDAMTEHVDFELTWARPEDVGYKLVAINVSDVAAMSARPTRAVATVTARAGLAPDTLDRIAAGMQQAATRWDLSIVGGDIGSGSDLALTLTVLGELVGTEPVLRSGAHPGDALLVTGSLGGAAGGLAALTTGAVAADVVRAEIEHASGADGLAVLAARQLRPNARLDEGAALAARASAMVDISDGLALDLARLCRASGVGCDVDLAAVPIDRELPRALEVLGSGRAPLELALTGGEDLELLFTAPESEIDAIHAAFDDFGTPVTVIGEVTGGAATLDGRPIEEWTERSWDHLRNL